MSPLKGSQEDKPQPGIVDLGKDIFGTEESLEHLRERLKTQHGVFFLGDAFSGSNDDDDESEANDQADEPCSNTTTSRSHSTDSEIIQTSMDRKDNLSFAINDSTSYELNTLPKKSPTDFSSNEEQHRMWTSITPKMEYEVDDQKIPSVFPCHLCTKVFSTSAFLSQHLDLHKTSPHKCMVCSKTFTNSQSLKRHMNTHTGEKPYTCPYCSKRFRDPSNFSKHKKVCFTSSVPSPAETAFSTSSVSSPQSLDEYTLVDNVTSHMTDLKRKLNFPSHPTTNNKVPNDMPLRFSYDSNDEEDLPIKFEHPSPEADTSHENSGRHKKSRVKFEADYCQSQNDAQAETREVNSHIPCEICHRTFENEQNLEMHMRYHSSDPKVTCIECGKSFADPFGLKRHLRIHAGIRPHVCEYCGRGYCDNWSLRKHKSRGCMLSEVQVPADFLHPCPQCARVFSELDYLEEHIKTHKGILKFECDICQKKFSEAFNLKRHHRLHMAICPGCDKEFKDIQTLTVHRANDCPVTIPEPATMGKDDGFSCPECGRIYSTKAYLERHKKFHSDLRPYVCEVCKKRFSEAFRLRRHLKVHNNNKTFSCQTCGKGFADTATMKRHMTSSSCSLVKEQLVQQQVPVDFPCLMCNKIFSKSYLLVRHMNVHSQIRPFACDECARTYKDISSLRRHQMIHQGIKGYVCPVCDKDFFYSDSLKRHMTGSCGKKPKLRRRGRSRGKRRSKRKSNNNINMKNNNTVEQEIIRPDPHFLEGKVEKSSLQQRPVFVNKVNYRARLLNSRDVTTGHWSCHRNKQCWRCNLKFKTIASVLKHCRIHCHAKPYNCPCCFFRWSRKPYLKVHLLSHKPNAEPKWNLTPMSVSTKPPKNVLKKSQTSTSDLDGL